MNKDLGRIEYFIKKSMECYVASKLFDRTVNEINEGMGFVLFYLERNSTKEVSASELAEKLNVSQARITKILSKLISANLIEKRTSLKDGRVIIIHNTELGSKKVKAVYDEVVFYFDYLLDKIGDDELSTFFSIANKIKIATDEYKK